MKLRNKKTGEIATVEGFGSTESEIQMTYIIDNDETKLYLYCTPSLTTFNEDWEDYKEPKEYWFIDYDGGIVPFNIHKETATDNLMKQIGNYFDTREEAEAAVEKLRAWKRLKDKGFRFDSWDENHHNLGIIEFSFDKVENNVWDFEKDLDLLFGGEE